jgi:hypothetical protein
MGAYKRCLKRTTATMLAAVVASALSGCGGQGLAVPADDDWVQTQDDATQISVELPGTTEMQTQEVPDEAGESMPARLWLVDLDDNAASIGFSVIDVQGRTIDLASALDGIASSVSGSVASQSPVSQGDRDAMDGLITFTQGGTDGSVHARVIDAGDHMVLLQSVGAQRDDDVLQQVQARLVETVTIP